MVTDKSIEKFCLKVDFERDTLDPGRVFRVMSNLIDAFHELDVQLVHTISVDIHPSLFLQDIESGSLVTWFKNKLSKIDDADLRDLNWQRMIGAFLVNAKHEFLEFRKDNPEITNRAQIDPLQTRLLELARETQIQHLPTYQPIPRAKLLLSYNQISRSLVELNDADSVSFISNEKQTSVVRAVEIEENMMEELLVSEVIPSESVLILKVKKPDYLGQSKWIFKHGVHSFEAKILHMEWLNNFQSKKLILAPGDSIRARVLTTNFYSDIGDVIRTQHEIVKVLEILNRPDRSQLKLLEY